RQPRHHEYARSHHGGGMDERRNWRGSPHGVGQPGMQEKLRRFSHRAHEQKQTYRGERIDVPTEEMKAFAGEHRGLRENGIEIHRAGEIEDGENAERKAEVADAIDQKGFDGGSI